MATVQQILSRVERNLGAAAPPRNEIQQAILDSILSIQDQVPLDALKNLLGYYELTATDAQSTVEAPSGMLEPLFFYAEESDGEYGYPWTMKSPRRMQEIRRAEGDLDFDSTATRIWAVNVPAAASYEDPNHDLGIMLYPALVEDRTSKLVYLKASSESGGLTLPAQMHRLLAAEATASLHSDPNLIILWIGIADREKAGIKQDYFNRFGLSGVTVGTIRSQ